MTLAPEKLTEYESRLRSEIMERECVLAALQVLRSYQARGEFPKSLELGSLAAGLFPEARPLPTSTVTALPEPAQPPPPPPKIHPDLKAIGRLHGRDTQGVQWAIPRMTKDYCNSDISDFLVREGFGINPAQVSVILTRLKNRGEIEEIQPGSGPLPALFRKPENPIPFTSVHDEQEQPTA